MSKRKAYEDAGVSREAAEAFRREMQHHLRRTWDPRVVDMPGAAAGLFAMQAGGKLFSRNWRDPVLVSSAAGVGTKLKVASLAHKHGTVGADLVALNVNNLAALGAEPLFFLDRIAAGRLDPDALGDVVSGIAAACIVADCAYLRGELAEMPAMLAEGDYDLSGFAVGVVERDRIVPTEAAEIGDRIIGLASSGLHANGFSLARKVLFETAKLGVDDVVEELGCPVARDLLRPTRTYVKPLLKVLRYYRTKQVIHGVATVTDGGASAGVRRLLGPGRAGRIRKDSWDVPRIFGLIKKLGEIDEAEMFDTFNMGLGLVLAVSPYYADAVLRRFRRAGIDAWHVGDVIRGKQNVEIE